MRRTEALPGVRMAVFLNILNRRELAELAAQSRGAPSRSRKIMNAENALSLDEVHAFWRKPNDMNKPATYVDAPHRSLFLVERMRQYVPLDGNILEIGCNVGRNLNFLMKAGYTRLTAIEINLAAIELLREVHPDVARCAEFINEPVEIAIRKLPDAAYECIYTMAVLEHVPRDSDWVFEHIVRITRSTLITIEDERSTSPLHFPRNYRDVFSRFGLREIETRNCGDIPGLDDTFYCRIFQR
jgi:SAM-dependent methyltransferase